MTLIVTALIAGAARSADGVAEKGIMDAYAGLKNLVKRCFGNRPTEQAVLAEAVLDEHEKDSETYEAPLRKVLLESGATEDEQVLEAAKRLLAVADPEGAQAGVYNLYKIDTIKADRGSVAAAHIEGGVDMGGTHVVERNPDPS